MALAQHLTIILDRAGQMKARAIQIENLVDVTDGRLKALTLTQGQIEQLEIEFDNWLDGYNIGDWSDMDSAAASIETILGI
jgi:hypothetical protein